MKLNRIILLHGFNSGPGQKAEEINAYLKEYHLDADYELIALSSVMNLKRRYMK
jgi:predicted esterase YcpF (UPF0227 family)